MDSFISNYLLQYRNSFFNTIVAKKKIQINADKYWLMFKRTIYEGIVREWTYI